MADVRDTSVLNDWVKLVRWARLGASVTAVALDFATYAGPDGTDVFPGTSRVALDLDVENRTVERAVGRLRDLALLEYVGKRRGGVSEYRLVLPPLDELRERITVPSPNEYKQWIEQRNKKRSNPGWRARHQGRAHSDVRDTADPMCATPDRGDPPGPSSPDPPPDDGDLRTDLKVVGAPGPVDNPDSLGGVGTAPLAPLASTDKTEPCPACGVWLDPGRLCGNRTCPNYRPPY